MSIKKRLELIDQAVSRMPPALPAAVVIQAIEFWERANCIEDFCVQYTTDDRIVFGGTNRVVWSVARGFLVETTHCSKHFVKDNEEHLTNWQKMFLYRERRKKR